MTPTWLAEARRIAARHAPNRDDTDDLAQEMSLRLLARPPAGAVGPWLERVGRNLGIDQRRERASLGIAYLHRERSQGEGEPSTTETPEELMLAAERRRLVRTSVARLPSGSVRPLVLRFWRGHSVAPAAARLGLTAAALRVRVHRALRQLRASLSGLRALAPARLALEPALASWMLIATGAALVAAPEPQTNRAPVLSRDGAPRTGRAAVRLAQAPQPAPDPVPSARQGNPSGPSRGGGFEGRRVAVPPSPARLGPSKDTDVVSVRRFDFEDDLVDAQVARPDAFWLLVPGKVLSASLLELRYDFMPEMTKNFEDL